MSGSSADSSGRNESVTPPQLKMPPALIERARALVGVPGAESTLPEVWTPPVPRDAATVVLVRDGEAGIEVFVQRRVKTMAFAAGMYVFPGGAVEDEDRKAAAHLANTKLASEVSSLTSIVVDGEIGADTLAARIAAVRETEEEAGFRFHDPEALQYIAHWITPEVEERRFDTRFYAAAISDSTELVDIEGESDRSLWISPADALAQYAAREMAMLPPTVATLGAFAAAAAKGLSAQQCVDELGAVKVVPLLPSAVADPAADAGISWVILNAVTGETLVAMGGAPAGSESRGINP